MKLFSAFKIIVVNGGEVRNSWFGGLLGITDSSGYGT